MSYEKRAKFQDEAILEKLSTMHHAGDLKLLRQANLSPRLRIIVGELADMVSDAEALHNGEEPATGDGPAKPTREEIAAHKADEAHDLRMVG